MTTTPSFLEERSSQIPAVRLLMAMGWQYLTPQEALALRGGKTSNVLLEGILLPWLQQHNQIRHKGRVHAFSAANFATALRQLKELELQRGLLPASAALYERLTLSTSLEQLINGDKRSFNLHYIDWHTPANNVYHVTEEFSVERSGTHETRRPDIVLFVNGIPLVVIECKRSDQLTSTGENAVYEGVSQMLRNQRPDEIPHLFAYAQLLLAIHTNDALLGTTYTDKAFWAVWQEENQNIAAVQALVNTPLTPTEKQRVYGWRDDAARLQRYFDDLEAAGARLPTAQDSTLAALLNPTRLLELVYQYLVYDDGAKKITRYQQYFAIRATLARVQQMTEGKRAGGVIWHTTGSGKSLTMVMLAKALALHPTIRNPRVLIVTDRIDLDAQIWKTFHACGKKVVQAHSGADLQQLIRDPANEIITTVIDKFEAVARTKYHDPSPDVFVLVDESHRGQYGGSHNFMKAVFPNGCYIGFTGTPLTKNEKSTAAKFGGFIHKYTMRQAVTDQAVVPLLYEGRLVDMTVGREALNKWFERRTADLTPAQKTDLQRKMSRFEEINRTRARLEAIAWDIAIHYQKNWRGTGFKGQLATASKELAIQFLAALRAEGIRCEVVISPPDTREGNESVDEATLKPVQDFWRQMMQRYGNEKNYLTEIKKSFGTADGTEILIVVDKFLVGFDEPRNTVLYVDKPLREHGLLQAIARVNRLFPGKDYGYIVDYRGVLGELNEALQTYNALENFDAEDVAGTVTDVAQVLQTVPAKHDAVWALFAPVPNKQDIEALQRFLEPPDRRQHFYDALNAFAAVLRVALSTTEFYAATPEKRVQQYKLDLTFFHQLRTTVKLRYAEAVDYSEYEDKIRKLLHDHLQADGVSVLTPAVNIFDEAAFAAAVAHFHTPAARAETIAAHLHKTAIEKMDTDPAYYRQFSQWVEDTLDEYKQGRLSEAELLQHMENGLAQLRNGQTDDLPPQLTATTDAAVYYRLLAEHFTAQPTPLTTDQLVALALQLAQTIQQQQVRDWVHNPDVISRMSTALEDELYDFQVTASLTLTNGELDVLLTQLLEVAKKRAAP